MLLSYQSLLPPAAKSRVTWTEVLAALCPLLQASHGLFDVTVKATGDTWIDDHHTNEDIGLALGTALAQALGDRRGIHRFGDFTGRFRVYSLG